MKKIPEIKPNVITQEQQSSMWVRIVSSIVAALLILPCIFFGGWYYFALSFVFVALGSWELVRSAKKKYNPLLYIISFILISLLTYAPLIKNALPDASNRVPFVGDWNLYSNFNTMYLSILIIFIGVVLIFSLVLIDKNFEVRDAAYIVTFGIVIGLGLQSLLFIRYYPLTEFYIEGNAVIDLKFDYLESTSLVFFVVIGSLMCDTGAYFTGLLFGRKKINERISPKKTWEGFVGGMIFSLIFTLTFGLSMAASGKPIIASLDMDHWYFIVILGVIISLISQLGDFIFSSIKRYYSIKDFGFIMPGHGGILDRIDSVLFASLASAILVIIFNCIITGNWEGVLL